MRTTTTPTFSSTATPTAFIFYTKVWRRNSSLIHGWNTSKTRAPRPASGPTMLPSRGLYVFSLSLLSLLYFLPTCIFSSIQNRSTEAFFSSPPLLLLFFPSRKSKRSTQKLADLAGSFTKGEVYPSLVDLFNDRKDLSERLVGFENGFNHEENIKKRSDYLAKVRQAWNTR